MIIQYHSTIYHVGPLSMKLTSRSNVEQNLVRETTNTKRSNLVLYYHIIYSSYMVSCHITYFKHMVTRMYKQTC